MTAPRRIYLPPVPRVRPAGSWSPLTGFFKMVRPAQVPVGRFLRPVQGIPLTGGQGQSTIGGLTGAGITIVQSLVIPGALSGSFPNPTAAGNSVVVVINAFSSTNGNVPNVTGATLGGAAGNFTAAQQAVSAFSAVYVLAAIWVDYNCAGGQTAVAVSGANLSVTGPTGGITIYEVAGLTTANPIDRTSGGNATSGASWSSGSAPQSTAPAEIWFGGSMTDFTNTPPGSPWNSNQVGGAGASGYQIVSAEGQAVYAGTQGGSGVWAAVVATLKGASQPVGISGQATISVGPQGLGTVWYPAQVTVQTSSGAADASTCSIYLGPAGVPVTLVATIFPGGIGTAALAVPPLQPGDYLIAQWTGGNPGDAAAVNVIGTMDSLMPV